MTLRAHLPAPWAIASCTLIVPVSSFPGEITGQEGWHEGPMPFPLPDAPGRGERGSPVADREARETYYSPRASSALYGSRWHSSERNSIQGHSLIGMELARFELGLGTFGYAMVHFDLSTENPAEEVCELARWSASVATAVQAGLPLGWTGRAEVVRPFVITHLVPEGSVPEAPMSTTYAAWDRSLKWMWLMASGTSERAFPPDPSDRSIPDAVQPMSADWKVMVLRDGAAFVASTPLQGNGFHQFADVLVRTVYSDAFLLGMVQKDALFSHADSLAALSGRREVADGLAELERSLTALRNGVWWQNLSSHHVCNSLMRAYHQQHDLGVLMSQVVADHGDWHRIVSEARERRTAATIGLLSLVGAPFAVSYTAAVSISAPSLHTFLLASAAASLLTIFAVLGFLFARTRRSG